MHRILVLVFQLFVVAAFFAVEPGFSQTQFGQLDNWSYQSDSSVEISPSVKWRFECGDGRCQVVVNEDRVFVLSGSSKKDDCKTQVQTVVRSLSKENGDENWSASFESSLQNDQQTFSGAVPSPQATPTICNGKLILLTFTGDLIALDVEEGNVVWQIDLVDDSSAEPVQFGFSSSPVVDPDNDNRIVVLAGGKKGGLLSIDSSSGEIIWRSACNTSSYATPVRAKFGDTKQWIVVTKDLVLGIDASDGKRLWEYKLPEAGLTNVPTPLIVDGRRMIISGQGVKGTRCVAIARQSEQWDVQEKWFNRKTQFFYSNWLQLNEDLLLGCANNFLIAMAIRDGNTVGRFRGFADGNLVRIGNRLLIVDGKGVLTVMRNEITNTKGSLVAEKKFRVLEERCWTPISVDGCNIYIRGGNLVCCLEINSRNSENSLKNSLAKPKSYSLAESKIDSPKDPVQEVFDAFENKGLDEALKVYSKLRETNKLDVDARIAIADGALEQGLVDVAIKILTDARMDFPNADEIRGKLKELKDKQPLQRQ